MQTELKNIPIIHLTEIQKDTTNPYFYVGRLEELPSDFQSFDSSHRHSYYALFYFTEGEGTHTIDFQSHPITENTFIFSKARTSAFLDFYETSERFCFEDLS